MFSCKNLGVFICVSLFVSSCANRVAPSGGPVDKTPALLTKTIPADRSTNVAEETFAFEFDDYVDRSILNAISIQPAARFSSDYYGDEITVTFEEDLLPNTTYALTIGTDWKDLHQNPPPAAITIIFSTGPVLDSGIINGKVSSYSMKDLFVLAYPDADKLDTSFNPTITPSVYRIPVGTSGSFVIGGLKDGWYRLLVARDANRNNIVDGGEDYAIEYSDIEVAGGLARESLLRIDDPKDTVSISDTTSITDTSKADSTKKRVEHGSASGIFVDSISIGPPYLVRFINTTGSVQAALHVVQGETWTISSIAPGAYSIDVVQDVNSNGKYDSGSLTPFTYGERWKSLGISITIRERWTTDDIRIIVR